MGVAADWKPSIIRAVERWLSLTPVEAGNQWRLIGSAGTSEQPGWLTVEPLQQVNLDVLEGLCLAESNPEKSMAYQIDTYRHADGLLHIQAPSGLPDSVRKVWSTRVRARMLIERLLEGLRASGDSPLADAFAAKRLTPPLIQVPDETHGLVGSQPAAYRACLTPGVSLVWGPPGAGKTRVLAAAIGDLIEQKRRVLLLSTANIAVDNALLAVISGNQLKSGQAIRVGPPHLAAVAENPDVQLPRLAATASAETDRQLDQIVRVIEGRADLEYSIELLTTKLQSFDPGVYRAAFARLQTGATFTTVDGERNQLDAALAKKVLARDAARAQLINIDGELLSLSGVGEALSKATQLLKQITQLEKNLQEAETTSKEAETAALSSRFALSKVRRAARAAKASLDILKASTPTKVARLEVDRATLLRSLTSQEMSLWHELQEGRSVAESALTNLDLAIDHSARELARAEAACRSLTLAGLPSAADAALVDRAEKEALSVAFERRESLRSDLARYPGHSDLVRQRQDLGKRSAELRKDAERRLIGEASVVATTLARSRLHRALASSSFDVVLIDEVGAAMLAEVMLALCRANLTAVLFGDFLQLGPIHPKGLTISDDPDVRKWLVSDPFRYVGISTAEKAQATTGCIALVHQHRFGPELQHLANDVIYRSLRDGSELTATPPRTTDIFLIDTDGVGEYSYIHKIGPNRGWTMIGVILARALADYHRARGDEVGIVTPYRAQVEATKAGLKDLGLAVAVPVGTAHAFQGREYSTIIFDMVEDGKSWIGRSNPSSPDDSGIRLFGVGLTRAKDRIYLLCSFSAIKNAKAGPLFNIMTAGKRRHITLWSAASLLGLEPRVVSAEPQQHEAYEHIQEVVGQFTQVTTITDERSFYPELESKLAEAERSMWMWSPWIANRADQVVPLIQTACERGVKVTVFLRPDEDRLMRKAWAQIRLERLEEAGPTIIRSDHEHRKVVIIDENIVLYGSLNTLSNSERSPTVESMLTLKGQQIARRLLADFRAVQLGRPQICNTGKRNGGEPSDQHSTQMEVRRSRRTVSGWQWSCPVCKRTEAVPDRT